KRNKRKRTSLMTMRAFRSAMALPKIVRHAQYNACSMENEMIFPRASRCNPPGMQLASHGKSDYASHGNSDYGNRWSFSSSPHNHVGTVLSRCVVDNYRIVALYAVAQSSLCESINAPVGR